MLTDSVKFYAVLYYTHTYIYIPNPAINIDTRVNAAFRVDKPNAAKSYIDITDC